MKAILWKNALLRSTAPLSTLVEITMPVLFMLLLTWIKTLANDYNSPAIAYMCGQTYPWNYAESASDLYPTGALGQCLVPPETCDPPKGVNSYYKSSVEIIPGQTTYQNLGYVASAVGQQYPWYSYTVGDSSPVFSTPDGHPPSPPFVKMAQTMDAKIAILPLTSADGLAAEATRFQDYLSNMLSNAGVSPEKKIKAFDSQAALEDYVTTIEYDNVENLPEKIAFGIVLNSIDPSTAQFDYSIRVNFTAPLDMGQDMVSLSIDPWHISTSPFSLPSNQPLPSIPSVRLHRYPTSTTAQTFLRPSPPPIPRSTSSFRRPRLLRTFSPSPLRRATSTVTHTRDSWPCKR